MTELAELAKRLRGMAMMATGVFGIGTEESSDLLAAAEVVERAGKRSVWECSGCGYRVMMRPGVTFTHICPAPPEVKP